jgi:hypothetical protein
MRPISNEKRQIIIEAKKRGETEKTILNWIPDSSRSSITKIWKQHQTTGNHQPKAAFLLLWGNCVGQFTMVDIKSDRQHRKYATIYIVYTGSYGAVYNG